MQSKIVFLSLILAFAFPLEMAHAKGCLKGAAVGGVAGHVAGKHGVVGAAAGCVIGRHQANKKAKASQQTQDSSGASGNASRGSTAPAQKTAVVPAQPNR